MTRCYVSPLRHKGMICLSPVFMIRLVGLCRLTPGTTINFFEDRILQIITRSQEVHFVQHRGSKFRALTRNLIIPRKIFYCEFFYWFCGKIESKSFQYCYKKYLPQGVSFFVLFFISKSIFSHSCFVLT